MPSVRPELRETQAYLMRPPWEFPEVFYGERPDPLDGGKANEKAWMDAFVGNPPFLGGLRIGAEHGEGYGYWLAVKFGSSNIVDLCAYFLRRCAELLGSLGAAGLIATNSVAHGDSRVAGLAWITKHGGALYDVWSNVPWPGEAAVSVCFINFMIGLRPRELRLDGNVVSKITSFLTSRGSDEETAILAASRGASAVGSYILGIGFVFDDTNPAATPIHVMHQLLDSNPANATCIKQYLGGEDLNSRWNDDSGRFVIDFGEATEEQARRWPDLFSIVETKVKPARSTVQQRDRREEWWRHATRSPVLRAHLQSHKRALAISQVTSHLAFSFINDNVVISHAAAAILLSAYSAFAVLQSRAHEVWAWHHGSTLKNDLRYTPTACFETFPFPQPDPRAVIPALEEIGERLYTTRAAYMVDTQQGLTQTYNQLKDPRVRDARVVELRRLHEEMDRAVLAAYGWDDLAVPPYGTPTSDAEKKALERFEDEVIDRLFALNAKRAEEERAAAEHTAATKPAKAKGARKKKGDGGQGDLGIG